tara:strand:+ start:486 stop:911 length:426 start_codon:yes stop_codon:yes gene_type:complete
MASILKVDAMQGVTSAGDITVTSEGGSATQSLQQGLAKAWVNFNGTGTIAARDSLNVSGLVDNSAGNYDVNFTNSMSNDDYSAPTVSKLNGSYHGICSISAQTTSDLTLFGMTGAPTAAYLGSQYKSDQEIAHCTVHGDLA